MVTLATVKLEWSESGGRNSAISSTAATIRFARCVPIPLRKTEVPYKIRGTKEVSVQRESPGECGIMRRRKSPVSLQERRARRRLIRVTLHSVSGNAPETRHAGRKRTLLIAISRVCPAFVIIVVRSHVRGGCRRGRARTSAMELPRDVPRARISTRIGKARGPGEGSLPYLFIRARELAEIPIRYAPIEGQRCGDRYAKVTGQVLRASQRCVMSLSKITPRWAALDVCGRHDARELRARYRRAGKN